VARKITHGGKNYEFVERFLTKTLMPERQEDCGMQLTKKTVKILRWDDPNLYDGKR
jgi:hypothetical protein